MAEEAVPKRPGPRRLSWPLRLFLALVVFDIVFRSLSVLMPWRDWCEELDLPRYPAHPLPAPAEWTASELLHSFGSLGEFFRPWPDPASRAKIHSASAVGRFALGWLNSRLAFVEGVVGIREEWPMFAPSVAAVKELPRARLSFADGSTRLVYSPADPEDPTHFSRWFVQNINDQALKPTPGPALAEDCRGYCNLLAHRHPASAAGSPLVAIDLFLVRYDLPPPGVDARAFLHAQAGPPPGQSLPDFYHYDAITGHGRPLEPASPR